MRSPINLSDWIPGEGSYDSGEPGTYTGFGVFSTDPSSGGVIDSRGAFNPAFNGRTSRPRFEAETDAYRSALPGLARRARAGDANAAIMYTQFYGDLASRGKYYDLAYSTGLNDKNAVDVMNHVVSSISDKDFGAGADQFRCETARYLSDQAKRRGLNVEKLLSSEQMMDDGFRTSFLSALAGASQGTPRSGGLKDIYAQSPGMLANAGLFLKKGLAQWEERNGLRDDATRVRLMGRAAEYYAKCQANAGLRSLSTNTMAMFDAAAGDLGEASRSGTANPFDDYSRSVNMLDRGLISYTGSADGDRAAGYGADAEKDGRTTAFYCIRDAYEKGYGANVAAGRRARDFDVSSYEQLVSDLKANLRECSPRASSMKGYDAMIDAFARDVADAGVESIGGKVNEKYQGVVDLNKLTMKYYKDFKAPEAPAVPQALGFRDQVNQAASGLVDMFIRDRPWFKAKVSGTTTNALGQAIPLYGGVEDAYDFDRVKAGVADTFNTLIARPEFQALRDNPKFVQSVIDTTAGYIYNANTVADPIAAGSGNVDEYRKGLADRINLLYMAEELSRRGVNLEGWSPKYSGQDFEVRGNAKENVNGMYLDLAARVDQALDAYGKDTGGLHGADLHNWHFLNNVRKGLGYLLQSSGSLDADTVEGKRNVELRKLFQAYAGDGLQAARAAADGAVALDQAKELRNLAVPTAGMDDEARALAVLAEDMFSDQLNPVESERARKFAAIQLAGPEFAYLDAGTKKLFADQLHHGVFTLMRQVRRAHPELPATMWSDDDFMFKKLATVSAPLFSQAQRMSEMLGQARQAELANQLQLRRMSNLQYAKDKEAEGL